MDATPNLRAWIGRERRATDALRPEPARFMQAALGVDASLRVGDALPPLWHWLYHLDAAPAGALGRDGHPARGDFLPPSPLPRRMWAGGRFAFHAPLRLGASVEKVSTIDDVVEKRGRSGALCFVAVRHDFYQEGALALREIHDLVYREDPRPGEAAMSATVPAKADWRDEIRPDPVLLFRYSALTFNGHRIHYDVDYCRDVEGYEGLVFHGPLTATLLAAAALRRRPGAIAKAYQFRATAPIAGPKPFVLAGRSAKDGADLWAERGDGALAMTARLDFA